MAKRIFLNEAEVQRASNVLKDLQIEHIVAERNYRYGKEKRCDVFIVVLSKDFKAALQGIKSAKPGIVVLRTNGARKYEYYKGWKDSTFWHPMFQCTCRHCGKTFQHPVKVAAWCSPECRSEFRRIKREQKKLQNERKEN